MKISELIRENTENLIDTMKKAEAASYRNTSCEYRVYIDSEGECGYEEWPAGDNGWFEFRDPDYDRYYIHTFNKQYYDIVRDWWLADEDEPEEDDDELDEDDDEPEEDDDELDEDDDELDEDDDELDEDDDELDEDDDEPEEYDREAIMEEAIYAATNSADAIDSYEAVIENAIEYAIEAEREEEYSE